MSDLEARKQKLKEMKEAREAKAREVVNLRNAQSTTSLTSDVKSADELPQGGEDAPTSVAAKLQVQLSICNNVAEMSVLPPATVETLTEQVQTDQVYISATPFPEEKSKEQDKEGKDEKEGKGEKKASATPKEGGLELMKPVGHFVASTWSAQTGGMGQSEAAQRAVDSRDFSDFITQASFVLERTLKNSVEMSLESALGVHSGEAGQTSDLAKRAVFVCEAVRNKVVTALCFQPGSSEYFAASYVLPSEAASGFNSKRTGTVLMWSLRQSSTFPTLEFTCAAEVTALCYSPFNPQLLVGGSCTGQIVVWDLRKGSRPVATSFPSFEGHSAPICELAVVGHSNNATIASASKDGRLCLWEVEKPTFPVSSFDLVPIGGSRSSILASAVAIPRHGFSKFYVGTSEGFLYKGGMRGGATANTGLEVRRLEGEHTSAVTSLECHPRLSKLVLSCGVDSCCRITYDRDTQGIGGRSSSSSAKPYVVLEHFTDFIYDIKWSPVHPSVFAAADGSGMVSVWNLTNSMTIPQAAVKLTSSEDNIKLMSNAASCLAWDAEGTHLAVGSSQGHVYLMSVTSSLSNCSTNDNNKFNEWIGSLFGDVVQLSEMSSGGDSPGAGQTS